MSDTNLIKVALVNIPDNGISGKGYSAPLGLAYIAAVIRNLGYRVKAFDLSASKDASAKFYLRKDVDILNSIGEYNPSIIGMSCSTTNRFNVDFWAGLFKKQIPEVQIIAGGPHPYFIAESYLKTNPYVDSVVMGEGEKVVADYLEAIKNGNDLTTVNGLAFRNNGDIVITPSQQPIPDLDEILFPARDLFPMHEYDLSFGTIGGVGKTATLITSRGCGSYCSFCSTTRYWKKVRFRSATNVVDEIESIKKQFPFIEHFVFFDDTLTANREHAVSLCREIISRKLKINWGCWSRTDIIDEEYFDLLKESGCTTLSFGIESGNDAMLRVMRKKSTTHNNYRAIVLGREKDICTRGTMIGGMPEEKFQWAVDSILFMAKMMADSGIDFSDLRISFKTFIFPGTSWEKWFRDKFQDFSWESMPAKYGSGSFCDRYGNIVLPCYQWSGLSFLLLLFLHKLLRYRHVVKLLSNSLVQALFRKALLLYPVRYPKSIYENTPSKFKKIIEVIFTKTSNSFITLLEILGKTSGLARRLKAQFSQN